MRYQVSLAPLSDSPRDNNVFKSNVNALNRCWRNEDTFWLKLNKTALCVFFIYRIYSRISRDILDKITANFIQFDFYADHKFLSRKALFSSYSCILDHFLIFLRFLIISILGKFREYYFFNSTYSRVDLYASTYIW